MAANPKGQAGEEFAAARLTEMGYAVLARNHYSRYGEVDIIAEKDGDLCFVEVKTRRQNSMVSGEAAISRSKQRKIITTALLYLQANPQLDLQPRFDVFCVITDGRGVILSYDYILGAFDGEAYH